MSTSTSETRAILASMAADLFDARRRHGVEINGRDANSMAQLVESIHRRFGVMLSIDEIRNAATTEAFVELAERRVEAMAAQARQQDSNDALVRQGVVPAFLAEASRNPASVAVRDARGVLTYGELQQRSLALARRIRQAKGDTDVALALMADRNSNLVVALVAAALADSPCVILSSAMWKRDLALAAAGRLVVLEEKFAATFPENRTVLIEPAGASLTSHEAGEQAEVPKAQTAAAVVVRANGAVVNYTALARIIGRLKELAFPAECVAQISDVSSAVFPLECWAALALGGTVLLAPSSANASEAWPKSLEMASEGGQAAALIVPASVANTVLAQRAEILDRTRGLLLLGAGIRPECGDALASYAKDKRLLLAVTSPDLSAAFVGRVGGGEADALTALGSPVAQGAVEMVGPFKMRVRAGAVGELHARAASGDLASMGARGRVRRDGLWEVFASAAWPAQHLSEPKRQARVDYWRERLKGIPVCCDLPADRMRPPTQSQDSAHVSFDVPGDIAAAVKSLAFGRAGSVYAVLLGAFAAVLQRYSPEDVVIGTPVTRADDGGLESAIAPYGNPLIVRPRFSAAQSFAELATAIDVELRDALAHEIAFDVLVEELKPEMDSAHNPLFQVAFSYFEDWRLEAQEQADDAATLLGGAGIGSCDLKLHVVRMGSALKLIVEYATDLFDQASAVRIGDHFLTSLAHGVSNPDQAVGELSILPEPERDLLAQSWGQGGSASSKGLPVHQLFAAQVERTPDAVAVVYGDQQLSYMELELAANALAGRLRELGTAPGSVVGVYLDRSVLTVVALMGILKAGAAYLPLDAGYPSDRLAFMVADSGAAIVVSRAKLMGAASEFGATVIPIDTPRASRNTAQAVQPTLDDLAYLIYTSGSTGRPKGVKISHRNLATFLAAMDAQFGADQPGTWLAVTSISFDISVLELLWTLTRGYRVVVRGDELGVATAEIQPAAPAALPAKKAPDLSLFFFGNVPASREAVAQRYRLVLDAARFGDEHGFKAVWTPERHFHEFGGLYPNPAVMASAIAATTSRIEIRAGSVVLPLHETLRVVEDWALVDNLSGGRVGVAFASGWQPDDFVLAPDRYAGRKDFMLGAIEEVRRLWRGERVRRRNGVGAEIEVAAYPRAIQNDLPIWVTSARHPDTFRFAGEAGAGVLTHLIGHSIEELAEKIAIYREAWRERGYPGDGHVALMVHTYVGEDIELVKNAVREPLKEYIRTSFDLMAGLGAARNVDMRNLPEAEMDDLLNRGFERFFATSGLLGDVATVVDTMAKIEAIGVDEIACLIDFGVDDRQTLSALQHLSAARDQFLGKRRGETVPAAADETLGAQLRRHEVTHLQCTPSLAGLLVADPASRDAMKSLRRLLVGGEALPPELAAALCDSVGGSVHNMYGPTEATVWATSSQIERGQPVVIGRPLPGYSAYVVDESMRLAPIGVAGELLLGGSAVASGYHGRPELTAEKFIPDHFSGHANALLYRTGDVVRWRASGELEFLGRVDHQVKLRGRRIELGEIEAALSAYPGIQRAVCDVRGEGAGKRIVAYFVLAPAARLPDTEVLREFVSRVLPDYMVPPVYVQLDSFPLTPNGKINRRALPDPSASEVRDESAFNAPVGELEQAIAAVWRQVLRLSSIGRDDDFFRIGGNSIQVVAARSMMLDHVGNDFTVADIFRYPTIAGLAAAISARRKPDSDSNGAAARAAESGERRRAAAIRNRTRLIQNEGAK